MRNLFFKLPYNLRTYMKHEDDSSQMTVVPNLRTVVKH